MATKKVPIKQRFKDKEYMNWQKACQVLLIGKQYLDRFVVSRLPGLHEDLRKSVGDVYSCGKCIAKDVILVDNKWNLNCPNVVCQLWVEKLSLSHSQPKKIHWRNSDMSMWPSSQWEVAKVYMDKLPAAFNTDRNRNMNEEDKSGNTELPMIPKIPPESIDIAHVLDVLINCKWLHANKHMKRNKINEEALDSVNGVQGIRNELFHNAILKVNEESVDKCQGKMELMMKKLRVYDRHYRKEIEELISLDPVYMDRSEYEKFLRLEASVTASLIDQYGAAENEQETNENLDRLLNFLESPENADLRVSVSMVRNIPSDIGGGRGEGDVDTSEVNLDLPLDLQPMNSYNIHMTLPSTSANAQDNEKRILQRKETLITDIELPPHTQGTEVYDRNHLAPDKKYKYRLKVINSDTSEERNGPWSEINTPTHIRIRPHYIRWQALCRMLLDYACQMSRKFSSSGGEFKTLMNQLSTTKTELYETHMLSVSNGYWLQISQEYFSDDPKLQNKYNYIVHHGDLQSSPENYVIMPVQSGKIRNISETLFLADFLCHMYRYIEAGNNPSQKHEELNLIFYMFKNDLKLKDDVKSQLKFKGKLKDGGVIDLDIGVSSIDEIEARWQQYENIVH